ncbi:MAG TPA: hypothetical protein VN806_10555 [Caulobacteraceae bacterium]|nr:hypothetical protein [Caulobacteraceae bacterium]
MLIDAAKDALRQGKVLELRYERFSRFVEVHAVGYSREGHPIMRCWQVGGSTKRERGGWRLIRLDEGAVALVSPDTSAAPRPRYKRGDRDIDRIIVEL